MSITKSNQCIKQAEVYYATPTMPRCHMKKIVLFLTGLKKAGKRSRTDCIAGHSNTRCLSSRSGDCCQKCRASGDPIGVIHLIIGCGHPAADPTAPAAAVEKVRLAFT